MPGWIQTAGNYGWSTDLGKLPNGCSGHGHGSTMLHAASLEAMVTFTSVEMSINHVLLEMLPNAAGRHETVAECCWSLVKGLNRKCSTELPQACWTDTASRDKVG